MRTVDEWLDEVTTGVSCDKIVSLKVKWEFYKTVMKPEMIY